jgi:hypothetical protein
MSDWSLDSEGLKRMELLEEIKRAYEAGNLRPARELFYYQPPGAPFAFACPLVALALYRKVVSRDDPNLDLQTGENPAAEWACQELGEMFAVGFMDGFDGHDKGRYDSAYLEGNLMGTLLAQEILPEETAF